MDYSIETLKAAIVEVPPCPTFEGRGCVIVAGGFYLPMAFLNLKGLRLNGCTLPVQIWHLGPREVPDFVRPIFRKLGAEFVDAFQGRVGMEGSRSAGWQTKCLAIAKSPFEEVLFLDADNFALANPEYLFDLAEYRDRGAIFWPDFYGEGADIWCIKPRAWEFLGLPPLVGAELESGQMVIHKTKCWSSLCIASHMNQHADFYYEQCTYGDKDTFRLAWLLMDQEPYIIPHRPTMVHKKWEVWWQHAPNGAVLFQHGRKWKLPPYNNPHIRGALFEDECLEWLAEFEAESMR